MKAAWFTETGDAHTVIQIGEKEMPVVGQGDVLVRIHASGVNPSDVKKRAGMQPPGFQDGFVIPHSDGAGIIEAVGSGVDSARVGQHVFVFQAQYQRHWGTAAEYVVVPAPTAAVIPKDVGFEIGACAGIPMMTAHRCVFASGSVEGKNVLVTGASGRVGFYAVQWAKMGGAKVIATAGSDARCIQAVESGADQVLNYRQPELVERIIEASGNRGIDRIVDVEFGLNIDTSQQVLNTNGVIASYSSSQAMTPEIPFYPLMFNNITVQLVLVYNMPEGAKVAATEAINDALEMGLLKHRIAARYPLEETAEAHIAIEEGGLDGCVVVDIG